MDNELIHIIIPSSSYYVPYLSVLLTSVLCNKNAEDNLFFHILTEDITDEDKKWINLLKMYGSFKIEYIYPDIRIIAGIKKCVSSYINNLCNYKLYLSTLFPDLDKVIVLEGDMIVLGSFRELYETDTTNTPFCAVKDLWCGELEKRFNLPDGYSYCNTGMFLANLDLWRSMNIEDEFKKIILSNNEKLLYPDQDIFNMAFCKCIKYLPAKWNFYGNVEYENKEEQEEIYKNCIEKSSGIIHYANPYKPWLSDTKYSAYFWFYARKSPYYEKILTDYTLNNHCKKLYYAKNYYKLLLEYFKYKLLYRIFRGKKSEHYLRKKNLWKQKLEIAKEIHYEIIRNCTSI